MLFHPCISGFGHYLAPFPWEKGWAEIRCLCSTSSSSTGGLCITVVANHSGNLTECQTLHWRESTLRKIQLIPYKTVTMTESDSEMTAMLFSQGRAQVETYTASRAFEVGWLVSRGGLHWFSVPCPGAFLPGSAWGAHQVMHGTFYCWKPRSQILNIFAIGCGAMYNGHTVSGVWTGPHLHWYINCLELLVHLAFLKGLLRGTTSALIGQHH